MVKKIRLNYVGYNDKISKSNKVKFQQFTDSLQKLTYTANASECVLLCNTWLNFFKDQHIGFAIEFKDQHPDSTRAFFSKEEHVAWSQQDFIKYLNNDKIKKDSIERIWINESGTYQIAVRKTGIRDKEFYGFILKADGAKWVPGQIKWKLLKTGNKYKTIYYRAIDHSLNYPPLIVEAGTLDFGSFGKWHSSIKKPKENAKIKSTDLSPKFRIVDDETYLIEMPSFGSLDYISKTDSLIKKNEAELKSRKHLIIDLRNNSGGTVLIFRNLMPYIYTNPILTEGGIVLATEDNIKDRYSKEYPQLPDSMQLIFKQNLLKLKAHQGELYNLYPIDTIKYDTTLKNPERVSFLVNRNTASAAELFILQAKQSKKVKVYGENTAGAIDYVEVVTTAMPCSFYSLWYPAVKSTRLPASPLDNIGIEPDIKIPQDTIDWIDFVKHH